MYAWFNLFRFPYYYLRIYLRITLYIIVNTKLLKLFLFGSDIFVVIISFVSFIT